MSSERWSDLNQRIISGVVLGAVGLTSVVLGGVLFTLFVALLCGAMIWELTRISNGSALISLLLAAVTALVLFFEPGGYFVASVILLAAIPTLFFAVSDINKLRVVIFAVMVTSTGLVMQVLRFDLGLVWVLWLVLIVVATDIAGYFAGRIIGGPKFWPSLSPKKTWSGTVAGWVLSAIVGVCFAPALFSPLVFLSILVSFASQMGDIAESALKRRFGVKDSSNLIPGHGGFLDRFDGMIAATLVLGVLSVFAPDGLHFFEMGW